MLARHAESLFWAGRYLERAEDTARLLDVTYQGSLQVAGDETRNAWAAVVDILQAWPEYEVLNRPVDEASVSEFLVLDRKNPGSIVSAIASARENFRTVREHLPTEMWESVNRFHLDLQARNMWADLSGEPYVLYELVKVRCQTLGGIAAQSMPRDEGYSFLRLGWMIERALITCRLLNVNYPTLSYDHYDALLLTLRSASALEAYRRSFQSSTSPTHVAAFLLQSPSFPRSVLFCLQRAEHSLSSIVMSSGARNRARRLLGRIRSELEFADITELIAGGLCEALDELQRNMCEVADVVASQYFRVGHEFSLQSQFVLPGEALV
jgi:uncharacterized alpha-E superfamily protein